MQLSVGKGGVISRSALNNCIVFKLECPCNDMNCNDVG